MRTCLSCEKPITGHFNRKRCEPCALKVRKRPQHTLTKSQIAKAKRLAGMMYQSDLAKEIGCSRANLIRWAMDTGTSLNAHSYKPDVIKKVTEYYVKHGNVKTKAKFPDVCTRSIVERYLKSVKPRQKPISSEDILTVARMAGLVSKDVQARILNRPNFHAGGIRSIWNKKFQSNLSNINGLSKWVAIKYVKRSCPFYQPNIVENTGNQKSLILWVDAEDHMLEEFPVEIKEAIQAMAKFQRWLHGRSFRKSIMEILSLEVVNGKYS